MFDAPQFPSGINPQIVVHFLVRLAEDHIEGLQAAFVEVTVPRLRIDRQDAECVIEKHGMTGWIDQAPKFSSDSNRVFGLCLDAGVTVLPMASAVVVTKLS